MWIDLSWKAKTDGDFQSRFGKLALEIRQLEQRETQGSDVGDGIATRLIDIYRLCGYNAGFLVPYFFPQYPYDKALSLLSRPFSFSMFDFSIGSLRTYRGSRQIGKSTSMGGRQLIHSHIFPKYRSMYIAPHPSFLDTYANRLREMERAFRFPTADSNYRQNLKYKEYPNGAVIQLVKCLSNASEARSRTTDELLYDECQLLDANLLPDIEQCQKASKIPSTIFAGTSTTTDSLLETSYQESSRGVWNIYCPCGNSLNCGDTTTALAMVQPEGPTCPTCSRVVDVTEGQFLHEDDEAVRKNNIGFHIPQVIIGDYANDPLKWADIYKASVKYSPNKFLEEILGIPSEEGAREITTAQLQNICGLASTSADLQRKVIAGEYKYVVSGCDWGGSDYNPASKTKLSYTVHAMIGIHSSGYFDILHFRSYSGMAYREVVTQILEDHVRLKGDAMASDFGVGAVYNLLLRESGMLLPERHLILGYVGPKAAMLAPAGDSLLFNHYSLNRTESITQLYDAIRVLPPRIRCYAWEEASQYLLQFQNLVRVPIETPGGVSTFKYTRAGNKVDDAMHAVNFAYVMGRLLLGEPLFHDHALQQRLAGIISRGGQPSPALPGLISG